MDGARGPRLDLVARRASPLILRALYGPNGIPTQLLATQLPCSGSSSAKLAYAVISVAFVSDSINLGASGLALPDDYSAVVWSGDTLPTSLSLGTYPDTALVTPDQSGRSLAVLSDAGPLYRVRIEGPTRSWEVWTQGPPGTGGSFSHNVSIPRVPMGADDLWNGFGRVSLDAIRSRTSLDALVSADGLGLRRAALVSTGFSRTRVR